MRFGAPLGGVNGGNRRAVIPRRPGVGRRVGD